MHRNLRYLNPVHHLSTDPVYIRYPQNFRNGSQISIDWTNSFELNGKLREFILVVNGRVAFRGVAFNSLLDEETSKESKTVTTCNSSRFQCYSS